MNAGGMRKYGCTFGMFVGRREMIVTLSSCTLQQLMPASFGHISFEEIISLDAKKRQRISDKLKCWISDLIRFDENQVLCV